MPPTVRFAFSTPACPTEPDVARAGLVLRLVLAAQLAWIAIGRIEPVWTLSAVELSERFGPLTFLLFHLAFSECIVALLLASGSWLRPCAIAVAIDMALTAVLADPPSTAPAFAVGVAVASALIGPGARALRLEDSPPRDQDDPYWGPWM